MPNTHPAFQATYMVPATPSPAKQQQLLKASAQSGNMFLSPYQEACILNWRESTSVPSSSTRTSPTRTTTTTKKKTKKSKSASASVQTDSDSPCPSCASPPTTCSCSVRSPSSTKSKSQSKSQIEDNLPNRPKIRGYYSSTRKQTTSAMSMTPTLPAMMTVRPKTPPAGRTRPKVHIQQMGSGGQSAPQTQLGQPASVHSPDREVAMPKEEPTFPKIAGARDPISQNHWRHVPSDHSV
ncbi:hypothetical protein IAR55_004891 [Kwoniella newhampshirensis]|uniref:Uncharacterized protein n=1 Tax=Kwoniella newhampshirensis TaxID=1651941 RepID=A0AAW0YJG1_9TREE